MKMLFWLLAFSCFSALGSSLASGHHAYAANYVDELGTIEGVVVTTSSFLYEHAEFGAF